MAKPFDFWQAVSKRQISAYLATLDSSGSSLT